MPLSTEAVVDLQRHLEAIVGKKVAVKINDNRSTMLSVRWGEEVTRVSLHRMFLQAPKNIMEQLACYISHEETHLSKEVKIFMEEGVRKLGALPLSLRLLHHGDCYNLKQIYDQLNHTYFEGRLQLSITWYGDPQRTIRRRLALGLYQESVRLIKIHRRLDQFQVPLYVISFVVYHEMLHHVCPNYIDEKGQNQIHNREFKEREKAFSEYQLAQKWLKEKQHLFFLPNLSSKEI